MLTLCNLGWLRAVCRAAALALAGVLALAALVAGRAATGALAIVFAFTRVLGRRRLVLARIHQARRRSGDTCRAVGGGLGRYGGSTDQAGERRRQKQCIELILCHDPRHLVLGVGAVGVRQLMIDFPIWFDANPLENRCCHAELALVPFRAIHVTHLRSEGAKKRLQGILFLSTRKSPLLLLCPIYVPTLPSDSDARTIQAGLTSMQQVGPESTLYANLIAPPSVRSWLPAGRIQTRRGSTLGQDFPEASKRLRAVGSASFLLALLQSLCTAVFAISGIRLAIGLTALAAVSGIYAPARGFHQDAIRIPMLILATIGALVNLAVIAWIRRLRAQPSAQWRRRELDPKQKRSERLQITLAIITLILVGLETWTHHKIHRTGPPPSTHAQSALPALENQVDSASPNSPSSRA